ncbi:MAG: hypothetical protein L0Y54_08370 [Sporichthyaceae bacterium]|nr:hypothetical protein [Sporichthyaceae bacterium]
MNRRGSIHPVDDPVDDELLAPAVADALAKIKSKLSAEDCAAAQLATRYAAVIDEAATLAAIMQDIPRDGEHIARLLAALEAKVDAQAVLAELGPKLLAVLESLGATPKGRAALKRGEVTGGTSRLQALRAARRT